jgi:hypothetical protein
MSEIIGNYIGRRLDEEGLEPSEFQGRDLEYIEGREKLKYKYEFSSGEFFEATENGGEAKFIISREGKEIFNFKNLLPSGFKFVTPEYWINLSEFDENSPANFRANPQEYKKDNQGNWTCGPDFISVGKVTSLRDVMAILHEMGHARKTGGIGIHLTGDKKEEMEQMSQEERIAWAEALKLAKIISNGLGVNLFEQFSDLEDLKKSIYTGLATHRYLAELKANGMLRIVLDVLGVKDLNSKIDWLDKLFDKRKLIKKPQ